MKTKTKLIITGIIFFLSFLISNSAFAAKAFFEVEETNIRVGETFETGFFIDTEEKDTNAIEGKIIFPEKLLSLKEIRSGNSVINFWIEKPNVKNNEVSFSGIIPGGYLSKKGLILSLVFHSLENGGGIVEIKNITVLANDGKGTPIETTFNNISLQILEKTNASLISASKSSTPETIISEEKDLIIPETFEPKVVSDSNAYDGKYFLVFATQDKGSGIDHYEVLEQKILKVFSLEFVIWKSGWNKTDGSYVLKDQGIHSFIQVKAIDKSGNERIATISPRNPVKWFEIWWIWGIMAVVLTVLIFGVSFACKTIRDKRNSLPISESKS